MIYAVAGVITASEPSWIAPFAGLSPRAFCKLMRQLRREGTDAPGRGRPWKLSLEGRVLLVAAYCHPNLTLCPLVPFFGVSKSTADRVIDHLGPRLALASRRRFAKDSVLIVDGTLVPTRDHKVAEQSKNYRYSTNHQVVIDADTGLVVVVGRPLPGELQRPPGMGRVRCQAGSRQHQTIADGGYLGTRLIMLHRWRKGGELPDRKQARKQEPQTGSRSRRARLRPYEDLEDPARLPPERRRGDGVRHAMHGVARLHNLALTG
ncbi:transposase [Streptomyces sp. NPDC051578]|uniref:transposase n=1 Tax=Streptomyces sp. NPDC051578 TaxID=3365662 RepID=UPI0037A67D46